MTAAAAKARQQPSRGFVKRAIALSVVAAMMLPSLPSALAATQPTPPRFTPIPGSYSYAPQLGDTQAIGSHYAKRWETLSDLARQAQGQGSLTKSSAQAFLSAPVDVARLTDQVLRAGDDLSAIAADLEQQFMRDEQYLRDHKMPDELFERHAKARESFRTQRESMSDAMARLAQAQRIANYDGQKEALGVVAKLVASMPDSRSFFPMKTEAIAREGRIATSRPVMETTADLRAAIEGTAQQKSIVKSAPAAPGPADLAETDDAQLTTKIRAQAATLGNNPAAIFNWVRNGIDFIPTYGSIQGSELTRINQRGNAADTASLLISLLRAASIPARYVYGTVEMPIAQAQNWLGGGIAANQVVELMTKGGIPATAVVTGGVIGSVRFEHTWVEAYVDFTPSRGAVNRNAGTWVPMDASFKTYDVHAPINLTQGAPLDAAGLASSLNASAIHGANGSVTGFDITGLGKALDAHRPAQVTYANQAVPNAHLADIRGFAAIAPSNSPILAGTLPYTLVAKGNTYSALPATLQHKLTLTFYASDADYAASNGTVALSMPLAKIGLGTIGVDYVPATQADRDLIAQLRHDNSATLSPYLINVLPQVQIEGSPVGAALLAVTMGTAQYWKADISDPQGIYPPTSAANRIVAGSHTAFVVDGAGITSAMVQKRLDLIPQGVSYPIRETLQQAGMTFWMVRDTYDQTWASQFAGKVMRLPSVGAFSTPLQVSFAFGIARSGAFNGYQTDVKRNLYAAVNPTQAQQLQMFTMIGNTGSLLEGSVWEFLLGKQFCTSASASRVLSAANDQRIPIYLVDSTNIAAITPSLQLSSGAIQEISNAVSAGKRVVVPQSEIKLGRWSGAGYVIQDPQDGTGVYQIDGGLSGAIAGGCRDDAIIDGGLFVKNLAQQLAAFNGQFASDPRVRSALYAPAGTLVPLVSGLAAQFMWFTGFEFAAMDFQESLAVGPTGSSPGGSTADSCDHFCPECAAAAAAAAGGAGGGGGAGGTGSGNGPLTSGDPISIPTGEKIQSDTDYSGAGDNRLAFTRTYSSFGKNLGSHIGTHWRHSYERFIFVEPATTGTDSTGAPLTSGYSIVTDTGAALPAQPPSVPPTPTSVLALRSNGSYFQYTLRSGRYTANADVPESLTRGVDGSGNTTGWTYFNSSDETEQYNSGGQLTSITNRKGQTTTLSYDSQGNLSQVRNQFGRTLTLTHNASGNVDTVTEPGGGVWRYGYDAFSNLTSVTGPDSKVRQYFYEQSPDVGLLTGITDENGNRIVTHSYDYRNRVIEEVHPAGANHMFFAYPSESTATVTDGIGTVRNYQFQQVFETMRMSSADQPCTVGCSLGGVSALTYDANGFVASATDFNGNVTLYSRDARGLVLSRTDASGSPVARTIVTTYDPQWRVATQVTEPTSTGSRVSAFALDPRGNVLTRAVTVGTETRTSTFNYNALGQLTLADGPRTDVADTTTTTYLPNGDLDSITDAAGNVTRFSNYDANGRPQTATDANGTVTSMSYDSRGRLRTSSTAGETTSYDYDGIGNLAKVTKPDSSFVTYGYDTAERLTSIADSLGNSVTYTLDGLGNRVKEDTRDPQGNLARTLGRVYDALARMKEVDGAAGQKSLFAYDTQGNLKTSTDPLSHATANDYDALNRMKQVTQPLLAGQSAPGTIGYVYDAQDNLSSVTDPRGLGTTYVYSGFNELATLTSPDTGTTSFTYDPAGNVKTMQDARGQSASYTYDPLNRLKTLLYSDESIAYTYDDTTVSPNGKGRLSRVADGSGSTTYGYDTRGRVTTKAQLIGTTTLQTQYAYNLAGQLSTVTTPSNQLITYAYLNNQMVSVTVNGTPVVANAKYFPFGGVSAWTWSNGQVYQRTYDQDGRIQSVTLAGQTRTYGFDDASRITALTDRQGAAALQSATIAYDNLDRLTSAVNAASYNQTFVYDLVGNRMSETVSGATTGLVYGAASNRLVQNGAQTISYDNTGNTTSDGTYSYGYSGRNRLVQVNQGVTTLATYKHNALGQRVSKTLGGTTTLFAYDEAGHLLGEYDSSGGMIQETVWMYDTPVATLRRSGSATTIHYVWADNLDTPRAVTTSGAASTLEWKWDSDPFGTTPAQQVAIAYNLRFPGQYFDAESGLSYNYFRDYDSSIGRYTESDPIGLTGGINTFAYAGSRPLASTDPYGLRKGGAQPGAARAMGEQPGNSAAWGQAAGMIWPGNPLSPPYDDYAFKCLEMQCPRDQHSCRSTDTVSGNNFIPPNPDATMLPPGCNCTIKVLKNDGMSAPSADWGDWAELISRVTTRGARR